MSNKPQGPQFVGVKPGTDPVVSEYQKGVAARAKAAAERQREPIPDLGLAQNQFDPKKDKPMTLGQIGDAQKAMDTVANQGEEGKRALSPGTLSGLQALHQQASEQRKELPPEEAPKPMLAEAEEGKSSASAEEKERMSQVLRESDDLELEAMMRNMRQDMINNDKQRDIIEAKVKPMNLADGITTGEYRQLVPIKEGLEVLFRSVSPMENEEIRRMVIEMQLKDERLANLSVDRLTLMQTVAAIVHVNGQTMPTHLKNTGTIEAEFLEETFKKKYAIFSSYPSALLHVLATHAYWFDLRVRKLFTMDELKNG